MRGAGRDKETGTSPGLRPDAAGIGKAGSGEVSALAEALEPYRVLFEGARDVVLFVRRGGQIIYANAAAVKAYGYTHPELLSMTMQKLRSREAAGAAAEMEQVDREGILLETGQRRKDGSTFPVDVSPQSAVLGGERVILNIVRDITERKRTEGERLLLEW